MATTFVRGNKTITMMMILVIMFSITVFSSNGLNLEVKIDEETPMVPSPPDSGIKCTACSSCENPCQYSPPPPPPSPILPPPPPPPPPTPTTQNPPSKPDCPPPPYIYTSPPPPSGYYIPPPPGSLYPIDPNFQSSATRPEYGSMFLVLVGYSIFGILSYWNLLL